MAVCECGVVGESMRTHVVHGVGVPKGNGVCCWVKERWQSVRVPR